MSRNRKSNRQISDDKERYAGQKKTYAYIDGNTVRKLEPERVWEEPEEAAPVKKPYHEVRKNRDKAHYMNLGYVMFLAAALCVAAVILVNYVQLQAELTNLTRTVASDESTLNRLKVNNDEEYNRIISSIDLEEIKRIAITELGMVYAQEGQIIEYENESGDYMRQVTENN